jgi:hypothetical protein
LSHCLLPVLIAQTNQMMFANIEAQVEKKMGERQGAHQARRAGSCCSVAR